MKPEWVATPTDVATVLADRQSQLEDGNFSADTTPTLAQVQSLLDLHEIQILVEVWSHKGTIPDELARLGKLVHAYHVAAKVENIYTEQVEQSQSSEFLERKAQEYKFLLNRAVKALIEEEDTKARRIVR